MLSKANGIRNISIPSVISKIRKINAISEIKMINEIRLGSLTSDK